MLVILKAYIDFYVNSIFIDAPYNTTLAVKTFLITLLSSSTKMIIQMLHHIKH
jgi:hypothetical protein